MTHLITLVVACSLGQTCQIINGRQVCSAPPAMTMQFPPPQSYGGGYPDFFPTNMVQSAPQTMVREPFRLDGGYVVPGSVHFVQPAPAPRLQAASAPRALAQPAQAKTGAVGVRRPYATPEEVEEPSKEEYDALLRRVRVLEQRERRAIEAPPAPVAPQPTSSVPENGPGVPQVQPETTGRLPVGQLGPGSTRGNVPLPSGDVARLPGSPDGKVTGTRPGNAPSKVVTKDGQRLPDYATSGMMWTPKQKEGYQGSPHQESHALIESLQVPEAPLPDLIDDSGKIRVTVMSENPEDRKQAIEDFRKGNGPLSPFKDSVLVRGTSPERWDVKPIGLAPERLAAGKPSVIMQEPGGRVIYASTKHAPEKAAEALRKANPNFDPDKAPGMGSGSACPFGFNSGHWPLIIVAVVACALMFLTPRAREITV